VSPTEYGPWGAFTKGVIMVMVTARGTAGVSVEIGPIDLDMLNKQNIQLIKLIEHDEDNILWGLVHMVNDILWEVKNDLHST
jgi:uncharacterized spore protein YtfJ